MQTTRHDKGRVVGRRRRNALAVLALGLAWSLGACGGPAASISITLGSTSQTLLMGDDEVSLTVTVQRLGGAAGDVTLSASGLPAGVSASFAPAVLSGATTVSTLTLHSSPAAVPTSVSVSVAALGPGLAANAGLTLTIEALTVSGTVVGLFDQPLVGVEVFVGAPGAATVATGADGAFVLNDVPVPYTLTVLDVGGQWAQSFEGLRTPTPRLFPWAAAFDFTGLPTTTVQGTLAAPVPASHVASVCAQGLDQPVFGCTTVAAGMSSYDVDAVWRDGSSVDVRVRALLYEMDGDDMVTNVVGHAAVDTTIDELVVEVVDIAFGAPPTSTTFDTTVVAPGGLTLNGTGVAFHLNALHSQVVPFGPSASTTPSLVAPVFAGTTYTVYATASAADVTTSIAWRSGLAAGASVSLTLPPAPSVVGPADAATGITHATVFRVALPTEGAQLFAFAPEWPAVGPSFYVTTTADRATIPDLSAYGLTLPAATEYNWQTLHTPGIADADDMVTGAGYGAGYMALYAATSGYGEGPGGDGGITTGAIRTFTTN